MVSLFGIKFGDKKKGKPERAAAGDNSCADSEKSVSLQRAITNESSRSDAAASPILPPPGIAPYAHGIGAQNQATSSMSNLADLHSNNASGVKHFASDANLRAKFGAMNGSAASLAHGPGPVLSPRPQTANAKSKPWDNSDLPDIPTIKKASTAPVAPKSPLNQVATDFPAISMSTNVVHSPVERKVEAGVRLVQSDEDAEDVQGPISKDQQILERNVGEDKISDEMSPTEPLARPHYTSLLDPLNGPGPVLKNIDERPSSRGGMQDGPGPVFRGNIDERPGSRGGVHGGPGGPGPVFRGNIDQRPGTRGGMHDGPGGPAPIFRGNIDQRPGSRGGMPMSGPNGPPRPFPAPGHGPPRHGPPTHGLPHPPAPRTGAPGPRGPGPHPGPHPGPPRQGPPYRGPMPHQGPPHPGTPNRGPPRQGPPPHGISPQGTPRQGSPHQGPPRHGSPHVAAYRGTPPPHGPPRGPLPHGPHQAGPHSSPHGTPHGPPGPLRPGLRGPLIQGSPRQGPPHGGPTPLSAPNKPLPQQPGGPTPLSAPNKPLPQQPGVDTRGPLPHGHATLGDLPRLQIPGLHSRPQSPAVRALGPAKPSQEDEASPRSISRPGVVQSPKGISAAETGSNSRSPSPPESIAEHLLDDDDSIFSRPIIKTLGARRDTLTVVSPRRQSLSMRIEELERSLIGAQKGRSLDDQQRSFDDKSLNSASNIYSQLHLSEDEDDDEPILSSIQPAPLRTPTRTSAANPMVADMFSESPTAEDPPTPIAKDDPETPIISSHPGSFSSAGGSGYGIPTPRRGGPPAAAFRTRRPALEEYSLYSGRSTPVSRPGRSDTASTTGGNMSSPYPGTADSSTFNSPQRSNTPQLCHPPPRRDFNPPTPALTPDPEPHRPAVSPLANAGFNFDFGPTASNQNISPSSTFGDPTSASSLTTTGPPTPDSMIGPGPAIISPLKPAPPAPRASTLNRPHIPAPLNFNFSPDADSRSTTSPPSQHDQSQQAPYTPPLRRATTPAIDGTFDGLYEDGTDTGMGTRPSTALGAHRPPPMTPIFGQHPPRAPSRAQTPMLGGADDAADPEEVARVLGIGVARGLSVKQPKQRAPERPTVPNPRLVDGFGTGMF
ncbi:hypothetical protein QR685DRAFT_45368 [Neurospora intermedia]|uniref:Uncharacterized protein n=1 Tax=Neurospora intermedia TaxID=5142 RepID=A0ABR3DSU6_NEUIN